MHDYVINAWCSCVYRDDKPSDEGTPWGEQEELEQEMLRKTGAKPSGGRAAAVGVGEPGGAGGEELEEFVFDEIDFVAGLDNIVGNAEESRCDRGLFFFVNPGNYT